MALARRYNHDMSPIGLSELVLVVADVKGSAAFYRDVVGLIPRTIANDEWAWFWAGPAGVHQQIALHKGPLLYEEHSPLPPERRFGQVHFAFEVTVLCWSSGQHESKRD